MSSFAVPARPAGISATAGGVAVVGIGIVGVVDPDMVGSAWFVAAGLAAFLLVAALLGLRTALDGLRGTRVALAVAAAGMALFGLAHFYALVDEDLAILLFSIFMIVASLGVIVAGVAVVRGSDRFGRRRFVPLLCGVWPVVTIPAGAAIGDLPHFLAIAVWGACWVALGLTLIGLAGSRRPALDLSAT